MINDLVTSSLDRNNILAILELAKKWGESRDGALLKGKSIALAFFEDSTRTRLSFELAAKELGAAVIDLRPEQSSLSKGETLEDTLDTVAAMGVDAIILRHKEEGTVEKYAGKWPLKLISAGQGKNDHPSQALLDALTILESSSMNGIATPKVTIVGDIKHSRVASSNAKVLSELGIKLQLYAPEELRDDGLAGRYGIEYLESKEEVFAKSTHIMALRIQKERVQGASEAYFDSIVSNFQIGAGDVDNFWFSKGIRGFIMHPGPVNWGVELDYSIKGKEYSLIDRQVRNGVRVRKGILAYMLGYER